MGTAQSSPKHERPAGAFFSCPCLRAGCSALRGLCRPCWLSLWRLRLPLRRGQARRERGGGARAQYAAIDTGCKNSFGHAVPCLQEGEARRKRSADEEEAVAAP